MVQEEAKQDAEEKKADAIHETAKHSQTIAEIEEETAKAADTEAKS